LALSVVTRTGVTSVSPIARSKKVWADAAFRVLQLTMVDNFVRLPWTELSAVVRLIWHSELLSDAVLAYRPPVRA
jgi:hypothetical protein